MGRLCGIDLTPELHAVLVAVLSLPREQLRTEQRPDTCTPAMLSAVASNDNNCSPPNLEVECIDHTSESSNNRPRITVIAPMTSENAVSILQSAISNTVSFDTMREGTCSKISASLSLEGVVAAKFLIVEHTYNDDDNQRVQRKLLLQQLESALKSSTLTFESTSQCNDSTAMTKLATSKSNKKTNETAFAKRLERLRLHSEERSYSRLTNNIKHPASHKSADEITVKSMTYAASIGLNMIVGPLAFGTFMYFFAGGIMDRFFDTNSSHGDHSAGGVDVRRVIAGVISGAFMLFVEMILFVIRSHELDVSVRKKGRKAEYRANPFGYTKRSMERTYMGD